MRLVQLGGSSVSSSILGLGCMGMSEFYGGHDEAESLRTLEKAFELGITHYDSSDVYGRGANERLVGRFARGKRDRLTIATKVGVVRDPNGPEGSTYDRGINNSREYMHRCCDESLARLGIDVIDLYYIHRVNPHVPIEESVGALSELVRAGKIRAIGLSEIDTNLLRRAHAVHPIAALQSEYSLWSRDVEREILPVCRALGTTFVAYSPLGRGFLTGAITSAAVLEPNDIRRTSPRFQQHNLERNRQLLERLQGFAAARGLSLAQLALAFIMSQPGNLVPIPGTKREKYLIENCRAVDVQLDAEELRQLCDWMPIGVAAGAAYDPGYAGAPRTAAQAPFSEVVR
ncbi:MAG: aldo/keto reductase [Gammaproteobacteria bacterium]|nr:aldo/keto reductase [Gammaproteobacteria bacterium]